MGHRFRVEALVGKPVLSRGDNRQICPVVKDGGPAETIDVALISSPS